MVRLIFLLMFAKGKGEVSLARGLNRMDLSKAPSYLCLKITAAYKMTKRTLTHSGRNIHERTRNYFPNNNLNSLYFIASFWAIMFTMTKCWWQKDVTLRYTNRGLVVSGMLSVHAITMGLFKPWKSYVKKWWQQKCKPLFLAYNSNKWWKSQK